MKPFNLEKSKQVKQVRTRDGREVKIIYWNANNDCPVIALVKNKEGNKEKLMEYPIDGKIFLKGDSPIDLMMI